MIKAIIFTCSLFFVCTMIPIDIAYGAKESGIRFTDSLQLGDSKLVLNGTGLRRKWFIKVYAAGLYLPTVSEDADDVLSMVGPKRMRMHFLYREVSREKLLKTLDTGFKANHTQQEMDALRDKIVELKSLFQTVSKGDEVVLDYIPGVGTQLFFNAELQGVIPGFEFHQALLRVWLGKKPADKKLKQGLLGIAD